MLAGWPRVREVREVREKSGNSNLARKVRENGKEMLKSQGNLKPINFLVVYLIFVVGDQNV